MSFGGYVSSSEHYDAKIAGVQGTSCISTLSTRVDVLVERVGMCYSFISFFSFKCLLTILIQIAICMNICSNQQEKDGNFKNIYVLSCQKRFHLNTWITLYFMT